MRVGIYGRRTRQLRKLHLRPWGRFTEAVASSFTETEAGSFTEAEASCYKEAGSFTEGLVKGCGLIKAGSNRKPEGSLKASVPSVVA
ncbi:hypothetical protein DPMN_013118 [Dreissena polymorpha]|uniref:Uncharacterized protein n=1 Tax=Dreissena polymorpha TaxID=45954 RepID=A0A9D4N4S7_DREPO|nr:hypothetical protein DPMN_013118 [Dreissena polymorpha]